MKTRQIIVLTVSLIVIGATIGLGACSSSALVAPKSGIDAQVQTAAAATVVQYMIETQVAVQSQGMALASPAQAQVTQPPAPTATPVPTDTPLPTAVPTTAAPAPAQAVAPTATTVPAAAAGPRIIADENTNCRAGPSTAYTIKTVFAKGTESRVEGRNANKNWWYIVNPANSGDTCWVWEGSTTVVGDTSTVAVVQAPVQAAPKYSNYWNYNNNCGPYVFCVKYDNAFCWDYNGNYWPNCNWEKWKKCNPYICCDYKPVCKNPCKKSNCPAVTIVNYKKYCKNYPQCCGDLDSNLSWN